MFPLLIALLVFAIAAIAGTMLLRRHPAPIDATRRGQQYLAGLRWREFAKLALQAMQARGYALVREENGPADGIPSDGSDILLERDGARTLLSCKYGQAMIAGAAPILAVAKSRELRGAASAIVITPGGFDEAARRAATQQQMDLIDGATLWPQVRPFVDYDTLPAPGNEAARTGRRALPWLAAAALGGLAWTLARGMQPAPDAPMAPASTPVPAISDAVANVPDPQAVETAIPTDPAELERRRAETASAISTLPGVDRAIWSTQSTLLVYLAADNTDPSAQLCPLLQRHRELAASRVQLQPPAGSAATVRFKQCQSY